MAEINFGSYSQGFDKFLVTFHIASAVLCAIMGCFAFFEDGHYIYLPPIFIIAAAVCGVNIYACILGSRHKKKNKSRFLAVLYGFLMVFMGLISYFSIKSFWF